jgi:hypothetical protein
MGDGLAKSLSTIISVTTLSVWKSRNRRIVLTKSHGARKEVLQGKNNLIARYHWAYFWPKTVGA